MKNSWVVKKHPEAKIEVVHDEGGVSKTTTFFGHVIDRIDVKVETFDDSLLLTISYLDHLPNGSLITKTSNFLNPGRWSITEGN
jgi:hypothetical protein